jgi:hypothetical protein
VDQEITGATARAGDQHGLFGWELEAGSWYFRRANGTRAAVTRETDGTYTGFKGYPTYDIRGGLTLREAMLWAVPESIHPVAAAQAQGKPIDLAPGNCWDISPKGAAAVNGEQVAAEVLQEMATPAGECTRHGCEKSACEEVAAAQARTAAAEQRVADLVAQIERAGCAAAHAGETTYECNVSKPCGLCRLRARAEAAERDLARATRRADEHTRKLATARQGERLMAMRLGIDPDTVSSYVQLDLAISDLCKRAETAERERDEQTAKCVRYATRLHFARTDLADLAGAILAPEQQRLGVTERVFAALDRQAREAGARKEESVDDNSVARKNIETREEWSTRCSAGVGYHVCGHAAPGADARCQRECFHLGPHAGGGSWWGVSECAPDARDAAAKTQQALIECEAALAEEKGLRAEAEEALARATTAASPGSPRAGFKPPAPGGEEQGPRKGDASEPAGEAPLTAETVVEQVRRSPWHVKHLDAIALVERYAREQVATALSFDGADATRANMREHADKIERAFAAASQRADTAESKLATANAEIEKLKAERDDARRLFRSAESQRKKDKAASPDARLREAARDLRSTWYRVLNEGTVHGADSTGFRDHNFAALRDAVNAVCEAITTAPAPTPAEGGEVGRERGLYATLKAVRDVHEAIIGVEHMLIEAGALRDTSAVTREPRS